MSLKNAIFFCAQVLVIQGITGQCLGPYNGYPYDGLAYGGPLGTPCGAPLPPAGPCFGPGVAPTNGRSFAVSSSSPIAPSGISVISENAIEGTLTVGGILPFLGAVALEAVLPTAGSGAVAYGCGNGAVGITGEDYGYPAAGPGYPAAGPGYPAAGPGYPAAGPGYPAAGPGYPGPYPGYGPGYGYGPACGYGVY